MVYTSVEALDFTLGDCPEMPLPRKVLLAPPTHFEVSYVINPHMAGNIGTVDHEEAEAQWHQLRQAYSDLGVATYTVEAAEGLPDLVFCANQTLPYRLPSDHEVGVVLSRMHAPQRRDEVPILSAHFQSRSYVVRQLPASVRSDFEGMGDALWHPNRFLLWGGYGFRTDLAAYESLADMLGVRILTLQLEDPDFYHLDTCLSVLDVQSALIYPGAFTPEGLALLRHFFPRLIEAPEDEARTLFACNAHCPDAHHVLIQRGCHTTVERLRGAGFTVVELETSEFLKAGGSVFCMKLMHW